MSLLRNVLFLLMVLFLIPAGWLGAGPLSDRLEQLTRSGAAARAMWGVHAVDVSSGKVLADVNGARLFVPASNRKLVSTALAASVFEPDERLTTEVRATSAHVGGTLEGDLVVIGVGDPSWSPELQAGRSGVAKLRDMARQAHAAGVRRVTGQLVIDTVRFDDPEPLGPGWIWADLTLRYGSRPAVLSVNQNVAGFEIEPGRRGEPVRGGWSLSTLNIPVINESTTGGPGSVPTLELVRSLSGHTLTLRGQLASDAQKSARAIPLGNPVSVWGELLLHYMESEGIQIDGGLRIASGMKRGDVLIAAVEGATIAEMMKVCNEDSDNFLAESLYLLAAGKRFGRTSYRGAYELERTLWSKLGVERNEVEPSDGCGLSRENFITPRAFTTLLKEFHGLEWFRATLPVSGRTGTLRYRLSANGMAGRVRAKTGTLSGVSALSGYVTTSGGRTIAFSVIANHYTASTPTIRRTIDEMVTILGSQ